MRFFLCRGIDGLSFKEFKQFQIKPKSHTKGQHGIMINFINPENGGYCNATFLPEVAGDNNWTKEHTVNELIKKAGYWPNDGVIQPWVYGIIQSQRYQSAMTKMNYREYEKMKMDRGEAVYMGGGGGQSVQNYGGVQMDQQMQQQQQQQGLVMGQQHYGPPIYAGSQQQGMQQQQQQQFDGGGGIPMQQQIATS